MSVLRVFRLVNVRMTTTAENSDWANFTDFFVGLLKTLETSGWHVVNNLIITWCIVATCNRPRKLLVRGGEPMELSPILCLNGVLSMQSHRNDGSNLGFFSSAGTFNV